MRLAVAAGALQERSFRPLFFGRAVSALGDALTPVALAFAVLDTTGSATDLGLVFAVQQVASVSMLLAAGVWADRMRRERLMVVSNLVSFAAQATTGLLLVSGGARLWHLLVLQALAGASEGAFNPARNAITPQVVSVSRLQQANALLSMTASGAHILGPVVAAALVTAGSPGIALLADAASFLLSAVFLSRLRTPKPKPSDEPRFFAQLRAGWSEFRSYEWLWKAVAFVSIGNLAGFAPYFVFGPGIAKHYLGGPHAWGIIIAANSAGFLIGGIISARYHPTRPMFASELCAALWPAQMPLLAFHPATWIVALGGLVGCTGLGMSLTFWYTTLQSKVPTESLSRVSSYDDLGSFVLGPLGFAIAGPLGEKFGVETTLIASALIGTTACLAAASNRSIRTLRLDPVAGVETPP
jgi:MFS family permease